MEQDQASRDLEKRQHRNAILKEANRVVRDEAAVSFPTYCAHRQFRKADPKDLKNLPAAKSLDRYAYYFTLSERLKPGEIQRTVLLRTYKFRWDWKYLRGSVEVKDQGEWEPLSCWVSRLPLPCPETTYLGDRGYQYMDQWWRSNRKTFPWAKFPEELRVMIVEFKEALEDPRAPDNENLTMDDETDAGSDDSLTDWLNKLMW